ncbi:MAG: type II toxin-antitoxin system VapC family toxin [Planctomycetes bacterium]|nr:type II toxin-antitoxin system VapC family toxin [Planctomycetota bacterium]
MRFWDCSALLPLLVAERATSWARSLLRRDPEIVAWWGTEVECVSALSRVEREDPRSAPAVREALTRLDRMRDTWYEVQPLAAVREIARRLLRVHPLRGGDATQLAAAIVAAEDRPATLELVTLDLRMREAAAREGFPLAPR